MAIRRLLPILLAVAGLTLSACGTDPRTQVKQIEIDPSATPVVVPKDAKPGDFPSYDEPDYTFTYETSCFCSLVGPVKVVVRDGKVASVKMLRKNSFTEPPPYIKKTINDLIAEANESKGPVKFKWPDGQAYPSSLYIDRIPQAVDDEVGYTIKNVTVN